MISVSLFLQPRADRSLLHVGSFHVNASFGNSPIFLPETAFPVAPCINDCAIFHWPELLPFTVAIYKKKATNFRNIFPQAPAIVVTRLQNRSFSQRPEILLSIWGSSTNEHSSCSTDQLTGMFIWSALPRRRLTLGSGGRKFRTVSR